MCFGLFGLAAFVFNLREGFYIAKIGLLIIASTLLISPRHYPFLIGLLIPTYFEIKTTPAADPALTLVLPASQLLLISILFAILMMRGRNNKLTPYRDMDWGGFFLIIVLATAVTSVIEVSNVFLYWRRLIEVFGFVSAYFIGRHYSREAATNLKQLLIGLSVGMLAFTLPWTVGVIVTNGLQALKELDHLRFNQIGAAHSL